ncbi:MAG: exodeoxyribonuclease VII small subunit [Gemmatimonadota bacterium]|jgi:exodeoxyribonuclease VII small subunit|nr:exodeoxyribonuclease VII small subunit [Gemmatimonadota bacterium]
MSGTPGEPLRLAAALRRLEEIVRSLEAEDTDLDQGLALFEEGVGLLREARSRLETAELKVQQVLQDAAGDLRAADLDV